MIRHHPYGGGYDGPARRGGSPSGPGLDRSHRFWNDRGGRGRGFARGRGGAASSDFGNYDSNYSNYDQGIAQGDSGAYNYTNPSSQDAYYQSGSYSATTTSQFGVSGPSDTFNQGDQGYGNFEDGSGYPADSGYGARPAKRAQRREKDDKVHDSIIEERIQRERPCRTLFIRNIKYETNSEDVRRQFEEHGEIKTFFDLISTRGMVFVTYYDLRAAERARERLQGSEISGRPIDVHYSLPRDDHRNERDKSQQMQGTLQVTLRNSVSGQPLDDGEVRRKFQQFGDVKSVTPVPDRPDSRYVEFYDMRASGEAYDRLRHQGLQDGVMEIVFASDGAEEGRSPGAGRRDDRGGYDGGRGWDDERRPPHRGRGRGRGRGKGRGYDDDWDRRDDYGRDRDRGRRYDDESGRGGRGGRGGGGGFNDRYDNRGNGYGSAPSASTGGYGEPPSAPASYGQVPAPPSPVDERLEQARKVQQLLAALKQPQAGVGSPGQATNQAPVLGATANPLSTQMASLPPGLPGYYPPPLPGPMQPQPPYPGMPQGPPMTHTNPYNSIPPPSAAVNAPPAGAPGAPPSLPPNILALLQQTAPVQAQQPQQPPPPPTNQYGLPPSMMGGNMNMSPPTQPGYQQLMAYLQSQQGKRS